MNTQKRERDQTSNELWEWSQIRVSILNRFTFLEIETFTTSIMDVLLKCLLNFHSDDAMRVSYVIKGIKIKIIKIKVKGSWKDRECQGTTK